MTLRARFYSGRNRKLAILAGVALVSVVLAWFAVHRREAVVAPQHTPQTFLPGLARALNAGEVTRIHIVSKKDGSYDIVFVPQKGWILPARSNFPASFEVVKQTLVALAAMETIEPKTDRPELFHYVDLDTPPQGNGVSMALSNDKGRVLASLIIGKSEPAGDESGGVSLFVRKAGENQSWLVRSPAEIKANQSDWMDKTVLDIDRIRVAKVDVQPATGPAYTISRPSPKDASFTVSPLPKGREVAYAGAGDSAASAMDDFTFDDIKPVTEFDFSKPARLVTHTFDGLTVTVEMIQQGSDYWTRVDADPEPGNQKAAREALAINSRAASWAFKLPAYKATSFAPPLETLLKPKI